MKQDYLTENNINHIDYKDVKTLKKFINPNGRIISRRRSGVASRSQRKVSNAIKRARFMGFLPFINR